MESLHTLTYKLLCIKTRVKKNLDVENHKLLGHILQKHKTNHEQNKHI